MVRNIRTHLPDGVSSDAPFDLAPRHLSKQEFGKRVYNLMLRKGWKQSELARQAGLPRDSISVYIRGKSLPTPGNLEALAKALGVAPNDLLPNHFEGAIDADTPALEIKVSPNAPHLAWLRVNRLVSMKSVAKIVEILEADNAAADGAGSRS